MALTQQAQAAADRSAIQTIKAFVRTELGVELDGMSPEVAARIALCAVIVKLNQLPSSSFRSA